MEIRNLTGVTTKGREVSGYAIVFNKWSEILSVEGRRCREMILPGAITQRTLEDNDIKCLLDHDGKRLVARSNKGKGSLRLSIDSKGLRFSFAAPKTADGDFVVEMVSRADLTGCSFAFGGEKSTWEEGSNGIWRRKVSFIKYLSDVSIVQNPAYPDTEVGVRGKSTTPTEKITNKKNEIKNKDMGKRDITKTVTTRWTDDFNSELQENLIIHKVGNHVTTKKNGEASYPFIQGSSPRIARISTGSQVTSIRVVEARPKTIFAEIEVSTIAVTLSPGLKEGARKELSRLVSEALNRWILSPTKVVDLEGVEGVFVKEASDSHVIPFAGETPTFEEIVQLETLPISAGIYDNTGMYITSPAMAKLLKTTPKSAGAAMIMEAGKINNYPVFVTTAVPDGFVGFGFFSNVVVNDFENQHFIIDAMTKADKGIILVNVNYDADVSVLREQAFSVGYTPAGYAEVYG